jgi:hypothetical protein
VKGSVSPANGASRAWLISKRDTLNAPVMQGNFMITNVKPGNYTLMLEAKPPFRDSFKQDVLVVEEVPEMKIISVMKNWMKCWRIDISNNWKKFSQLICRYISSAYSI